MEEGVIEGGSLDADPDPPHHPLPRGPGEGWRKRIHAGQRIRLRICCRLWLLWMSPYSLYT